MIVKEYAKVELRDGRRGCVIEIFGNGAAYMIEEPTPGGESLYNQFTVSSDEIVRVLPDDIELPDPYKEVRSH